MSQPPKIEPVKICPNCHKAKTFGEFYRSKSHKNGLSAYCKPCTKTRVQQYQKNGNRTSSAIAKARRQTRELQRTDDRKTVNRTIKPSLRDFEVFSSQLVTEFGAPLHIEPFQRQMLRDYFNGTTETVIILPKKNGKTTLLAALGIYHIARTPDAECIIGASSRDQATILFKQAAGLIQRSNFADEFDVRPGYREIRLAGERMGSRIRVIAADAATADGVIPTLALVDELHRHPSGELYGVFRDGLGPRAGQMLTISTAGASMQSPLGELRTKAHEMPNFVRKGCRNYVRSADGGFALHEWCLGSEDDASDMQLVKKANPAPWQTVEQLQRRYTSPSTTPWQWLRFACGVWTEGEEPWIAPGKWDDLASPVQLVVGAETVLGVRVGPGHDSAAIVAVSKVGEKLSVRQHILEGLLEGDLPPLVRIEQEVRRLVELYKPTSVVYTSTTFRRSADLLEAEGLDILEMPYTPVRMMQVSETLLKLIEEKRLVHDGDPDMRRQVLAARIRQTERGWRFSEESHSETPVDALIALAIAAEIAESADAPQPMFAFT